MGGVHKLGLHVVSRDGNYAKLVDHLVTSALCSVVFTWPIFDEEFGRKL